MRTRLLILTAAAGASLIVVAVSKPSQGKDTESTDNREISLATMPGAAAPVVSALEAGKSAGSVPVLPRRAPVRQRVAAATAAAASPEVPSHLSLAMDPALAMSSTTSSMAPDLAPEAVPVVERPQGIPAVHVHDAGFPPEVVSAGPRIIIRGGMGSVHDDCKIATPGQIAVGRNVGAAVNRQAPSFSGGGMRSGVSGSNGGHFPRGGIR